MISYKTTHIFQKFLGNKKDKILIRLNIITVTKNILARLAFGFYNDLMSIMRTYYSGKQKHPGSHYY